MNTKPTREDAKQAQKKAAQAFRQSKMDEAIGAAEEWLSLARRYSEESVEVAEALNFLGKIHWTLEDSDAAVIYFKEALDIIKKVKPNSTTMAKTLTNMGFIYRQHERHSQALRLLEESLSILEKADPESMCLANNYSNVAMVLKELGRLKESIRREKQAMEIKEKIVPGTESLAVTYLSIGRMYLDKSIANPSKAIKYLQLAQEIATPLDKDPLKMDVTMSLNEALSMELQKLPTSASKAKKASTKSKIVVHKSVRPNVLSARSRLISI